MRPPDPPAPYGQHFGNIASRYDQLRKDPSDENIAAVVDAGNLRGRRVLDLGCGTGRVAAVLAEQYAARVCGIDLSAAMLGVARQRCADVAVGLGRGRAERIPLKTASLERALMQVVVHLVDRAQAFSELHRVLAPGGRLVICTVDPRGVERIWLSHLFPSYADIDRRRFAAPEVLAAELTGAGFIAARSIPFVQPVVYAREEALQLLRGRYASSFALIGEEEYQAGLARAERDLPARVEFSLQLAIVVADR